MVAVIIAVAGLALVIIGILSFIMTIITQKVIFPIFYIACFPIGGILLTIGLIWLGIANWDSIYNIILAGGSL